DGAIVVFTPGTFIATERGQRPVEQLRRGDRVVTRNDGLKRVSWIGRRDISYHDLNAADKLRPVLVKRGALGQGRPERDMLISPQHRLHVRGQSGLLSAFEMIDHSRIVPAPALGVSYLHVLLNAQEVILCNGAWAECFHPDDAAQVCDPTTDLQRQEILALFPEIATMGAAKRVTPARQVKNERSRFDT
ncbi:unnamed protein product, partial [Ectocarpus sp. 12 AP-2014]